MFCELAHEHIEHHCQKQQGDIRDGKREDPHCGSCGRSTTKTKRKRDECNAKHNCCHRINHTHVTYAMRLIGSFQTITTQGRSRSTVLSCLTSVTVDMLPVCRVVAHGRLARSLRARGTGSSACSFAAFQSVLPCGFSPVTHDTWRLCSPHQTKNH